MLFGKRRGLTSTAIWASIGCLAFVAAAIWGWDLSWQQALEFFFICVVLIVAVVLAAALMVAVVKVLQRLLRRKHSEEE